MRLLKPLCLAALALAIGSAPLLLSACKKPSMPNMYGPGRFHDLTQIRTGMSPNEVQRIMGSKFKTIWEEGLGGADMGNYIWEYEEGRIYFNTEGVYRVVPFNQ